VFSLDITKYKMLEDSLKENEEFFRYIIENSHSAIVILNDVFRIIYANKEAENLSGYSSKEIVGQDFRKFIGEDKRREAQKSYLKGLQRKNVIFNCAFEIVRKDGQKRNVKAKTFTMNSKCGRPYTAVQLLDVTEDRKAEQERKHFDECISALNGYGQNLSLAKDMSDIYKLTLDAMQKILGFEYASILMIEDNNLCLKEHSGYSSNFGLKLPLDGKKGITVKVARTGKPVIIDDVTKEKAYVKGGEGIHSELVVPLKIGKRILGVINVESKKVAAFGEEDRKLLELLASHASIAMSNLRRRERLHRISQNLEHLMKSTTQVMRIKNMHKRLKIIVNAIQRFGWRSVAISLRNHSLRRIDIVSVGLPKKESMLLRKKQMLPSMWRKLFGPELAKYKIGEFYYLPWNDPWVRENIHTNPRKNHIKKVAKHSKTCSQTLESTVNWHPRDLLYAPLCTPEGKTIGILSMDDPEDGRKPTKESLAPLEIFLHQVAMVIENAQLIEELKEARELLEQKVEERTRELKKSQELLLKAQRFAVIGELAGMIGHDLRNPLTSIAGATYFVKRQLGTNNIKKIEEMLNLIEKNIAYSNKIINDLLDYSREICLDFCECTPKRLVHEVLSLVDIPKNITVVDQTNDELKLKVDVEKVTRAFVNIVKNAVDAMPNGGTLTIKCQKRENAIEFAFSDTGVGMSKETMQKLWTPLFTTKAKGMGFGLPICKRIIEAHKGSIAVSSVRRKGTTFTVTLPIAPKTEDEGGEKIWITQPEYSLLTTTKT
ncbi:MAG: GAF domain-containing protein, partial [Candidatus Bathyarchaeia archaeon]